MFKKIIVISSLLFSCDPDLHEEPTGNENEKPLELLSFDEKSKSGSSINDEVNFLYWIF